MHTTTVRVNDQTYHVHHNGDWSGTVVITTPEKAKPGMIGSMDLPVFEGPYELLEAIVGSKLINEKISELEQMRPEQFLKCLTNSPVNSDN